MPLGKNASFDITVLQRGDLYIVSGKDAAALYEKMQGLPPEIQTFLLGSFQNGQFTMQKIGSESKKMAANS